MANMRPDEAENSRDPITVTVQEAHRLSGYGFTTLWKFIKEKRLRVVRVPGVDRTLIEFASLRQLLTPPPSEDTTVRRRGDHAAVQGLCAGGVS